MSEVWIMAGLGAGEAPLHPFGGHDAEDAEGVLQRHGDEGAEFHPEQAEVGSVSRRMGVS